MLESVTNLNTYGYAKIKMKGSNLDDLIWNDETITSESDIREKFVYGGLTTEQWTSRYGLIPTDMAEMANSIVDKLIEHYSDCSTIQAIVTAHGASGLKDGINAIYTANGWEADSGWLANNRPAGREHLDWSDHRSVYQRYGYFWDLGNQTTVQSPTSFVSQYTHGGMNHFQWYLLGQIPEELIPELNALLHGKVANDDGEIVTLYDFLDNDFTQSRLNTIMEELYDADDGAISRAFKTTHGCSLYGEFTADQLTAFAAKKTDAVANSFVGFFRPQTYAMALDKFRPTNASKAAFMTTHSLSEEAYMFVFNDFLKHKINGSSILEYINSDGKTIGTTSFSFMEDAAQNFINSVSFQAAIDAYNNLPAEPVDNSAEDNTGVGSSPSEPPIGAVNSGNTQGSDDGDSDASNPINTPGAQGSSSSDNASVAEAVNNTNVNRGTGSSTKSKGVGTILILGGLAAILYKLGKD